MKIQHFHFAILSMEKKKAAIFHQKQRLILFRQNKSEQPNTTERGYRYHEYYQGTGKGAC